MKKKITKWIKCIKYLFNFRKPIIREFNCIDIVAGNKLLFLMAWDTLHAGRIKVHPGRHVYRRASGAVIIALPTNTTSVDISAHNCWRKTVITVPIKKLTLDRESFDWLTSDIRLFAPINLTNFLPDSPVYLPEIKIGHPVVQTFFCQSHIKFLFNYQNLNSI